MSQAISSISVVMPVRNREHIVGASLDSVAHAAAKAAGNGLDIELLVVDDASEDGTLSILRHAKEIAPVPLQILQNHERQGPARARNVALEMAHGELVVFVDSDVIVPEGFFEAHAIAHQNVGIYVNGALIWVETLEEALAMPQPTVWDFSSRSLGTANASVRREHLQAVGGFDPVFKGMGWEDSDLGRRLQQYGLKRVQEQSVLAYHVEPAITTPEQLAARLDKERERGTYAVDYMAKHPDLRTRLSAQATGFHRFLSAVFLMGGLVREDNVLRWMAWARRRGYFRLEKMWFQGVVSKVYLQSLRAAMTRQLRG